MEIENIKTNISTLNNELKNKFKLPIFVTYSIILTIYNWDIFFYLAFEKNIALNKITYVKQSFFTENFSRVWIPILVAVLYSIIFPLIQVFINFVLQIFKRFNNKITRKEEIDNAVHSFNIQQQLSGQQSLQQLQNKIDQLILEKENLLSTNNSLLGKISQDSDLLDSRSIEISQYDTITKSIFNEVNKFSNEEKSTFIEIILLFNENSEVLNKTALQKKSSYPDFTGKIIKLLLNYNIIREEGTDYYRVSALGSKFITYFKSEYIK